MTSTSAGSQDLAESICAALASASVNAVLACDGERIAFPVLADAIERRAQEMRASGLTGRPAYIASGRGIAYWIDLVAAWRAAVIAVPVDGAMPAERLAQMSGLTGAATGFGLSGAQRMAMEIGAANGKPVFLATEVAAILFTSGSTGPPKAVSLTHAALLGNARATIESVQLSTVRTLAVAVPFHFTSAICHFIAAVLQRVSLHCTEQRLFQSDLFAWLQGTRADGLGGAPLQLKWIAECAADAPTSLAWLMSSGDALSPVVIERIASALPRVSLYTVYGLTEVGGRFCVLPADDLPTHAGSVGRPIQGMQLSIRDELGNAVDGGVVGEVYANGPYLAQGYLSNPDETARKFTAHGFATGDLGRTDSDGRLRLVGRADDVFKVAGQKVDVGEITRALLSIGGVSDAAVVGLPDSAHGHAVHAFVAQRSGEPPLTAGGMLRALRRLLPPNHLPERIMTLDQIPRTGSGKVQRAELLRIARLPSA